MVEESSKPQHPTGRSFRVGETVRVVLRHELAEAIDSGNERRAPGTAPLSLDALMGRCDVGRRMAEDCREGRLGPTGGPSSGSMGYSFVVSSDEQAQLLARLCVSFNDDTDEIVNIWVARALTDEHVVIPASDDVGDADRSGVDRAIAGGEVPPADELAAGGLAGLAASVAGLARVRDGYLAEVRGALDRQSEAWARGRRPVVQRVNDLTDYLKALDGWVKALMARADEAESRMKGAEARLAALEAAGVRPPAASAPASGGVPTAPRAGDAGSGGAAPPEDRPRRSGDGPALGAWVPSIDRLQSDDRLIQLVNDPFRPSMVDRLLDDDIDDGPAAAGEEKP